MKHTALLYILITVTVFVFVCRKVQRHESFIYANIIPHKCREKWASRVHSLRYLSAMADGSDVPHDLQQRLKSCCGAGNTCQVIGVGADATVYMYDDGVGWRKGTASDPAFAVCMSQPSQECCVSYVCGNAVDVYGHRYGAGQLSRDDAVRQAVIAGKCTTQEQQMFAHGAVPCVKAIGLT